MSLSPKYYHSPDIRESIVGTPKQWLEPELRRRILDQRGSEGYEIDSAIQIDIDALAGLPALPDGFLFYVDLDAAYLVDLDGNFLIGPAP